MTITQKNKWFYYGELFGPKPVEVKQFDVGLAMGLKNERNVQQSTNKQAWPMYAAWKGDK